MNLYNSKKLSSAIDSYLKDGTNSELDSDLEELFKIGMELSDINIDISEESKSDAYKNMINQYEKENLDMSNNRFNKKIACVILAGVIGIGAVQTGFAQNMYDTVKKIINLKYISVEENNSKEPGEVFSSNDNNYVYIDDIDKSKELVKFDLKIPEILPIGYEFKNACFYVDKIEDISGEYISLFFTNGEKEFFITQIFANEDNSFTTKGKEIEEITINGRKAVIDNRGNIDIEIDDIIISLLTQGNISRDEAINIVNSIE